MSALYVMRFASDAGRGAGAIYIGKGLIAGVDMGDVRFDGSYTETNGTLTGTVDMTKRQSRDDTTTFHLNWPANFSDGSEQLLTVDKLSYKVTLEKLKDIP